MLRLINSKNPVLELLFPSNAHCLGCENSVGTEENWLCSECLALLTRMDVMISAANEKWPRDSVSIARSVYRYTRPVNGLIRAFKYDGVYSLADWFAERMAASLLDWEDVSIDYLVPVPMYISRKRKRGFNQTDVLTKSLSEKVGIPYLDALRRVVNTPQQARSTDKRRMKDMRGAFKLAADVNCMNLLLIDDVLTSGATANACAAVLLSGGATEVNLMTIATGHGTRSPS